MKKLVLDTSVLTEYIVLRSPYRSRITKLLDNASASKLKLYVSAVTLSEVLYIASRIYQVAKVSDPNREASDFVEWIKSRVQVINTSEDIALRAGELKKQLHIALTECYVIASAETVEAIPLFKELEEEMKPVESDLRRLSVKFLDEIEL